jgi:hypothetical protein
MNLEHRLIPNRHLLLRKNRHQNLLQLLIEKDQIKANHQMFSHRVHPIPRATRKVKHLMINQVIHHHHIIIKLKQNLFLQSHQKNQQHRHQ